MYTITVLYECVCKQLDMGFKVWTKRTDVYINVIYFLMIPNEI